MQSIKYDLQTLCLSTDSLRFACFSRVFISLAATKLFYWKCYFKFTMRVRIFIEVNVFYEHFEYRCHFVHISRCLRFIILPHQCVTYIFA